MVELNLESDESIVLEAEDVQKIGQQNEKLIEFYLTNKNLVYVISRKNGIFAKPTMEVTKIPLEEIKVISNQVQVSQVKNSNYGICLQIQFVHGRELFVFNESPRRVTPQWVNEINRMILGVVPEEVKQKSNPFGGLSGLASNFKSAADSAMQTVSSTAKQMAGTAVEQTTSSFQAAKEQYETTKKTANEKKITTEPQVKSSFCVNCGEKLVSGAQFCPSCGSPTVGTSVPPVPATSQPPIPPVNSGNSEQRHQEYAGKVLKCPNCGAVISQTTAICPECGMRITGQAAVNSVQRFSEQLMAIEGTRKKVGLGTILGVAVDPADQKKLSLVRSFPIPNTIDDIMEFMLLAVVNIDVGLSKNTMMNRYQSGAKSGESNATMPKTISDAWVSKMQQAYQKAAMAFPNDPAFANIKQIYSDKMKELKIKTDL